MNVDYDTFFNESHGINPTMLCYAIHLYEELIEFPTILKKTQREQGIFEDFVDRDPNASHHTVFLQYVNALADEYIIEYGNRMNPQSSVTYNDEFHDTYENNALHFLCVYWLNIPSFTANPKASSNHCE